jgi:glycosyltransferase involved in cell wall biosynthesis
MANLRAGISVIIPAYNRRSLIGRALGSVIRQSLPASQIIVIDDGSTDGTGDFVHRNFPQVQLVEQPNLGVSAARNLGIRLATGEWIALLDSDDEWVDEKLERQVAALSKNSQLKLCHTDEIWIRNGVRVNPMTKHAKFDGWIFEKCLPLCCISPSSVLIHHSVFKKTGVFDEELPACEDYDLWLRITHRYPVLLVDEKLVVKYGGHEDQLSRQHWGMDRFRVQALLKMLEIKDLDLDAAHRVRQTMLDKIAVLMKGFIKRDNRKMAKYYQQIALRWKTCD